MPKVSVYIPTYNCRKYLGEAIESVLNQTYQDFELIIVDDASTDNTLEFLEKYSKNPKIKIVRNKKNQGFIRSAIRAINLSRGKYIFRLDADDYIDENTLMILISILDKHPEIQLVFPDFFYINERGEIIEYFRKKKVKKEMKLLDLPPNSGGTLMRRSAYKKIGGYRDDIRAQDKYDLWLKVVKEFKPSNVYNINLPLYYYRRHDTNISNETKRILKARQYIKKRFVKEKYKGKVPNILGIIPARARSRIYPDFPTKKLAGKPLIYYPIRAMKEASWINKAVFTTEDNDLAKEAKKLGIDVLIRPEKFAKAGVSIEPTINYVVENLEKKEKYSPEIVVVLYITSPLVTADHITEAVNTLLIFDADSVISVSENKKFQYRHGEYGLKPLYEKRLIRYEKDLLFEETGSLIVSKRKFISPKKILGKKISHILLGEDEAVDIDNKFHFWLAEQILKNRKKIDKLL
jgi:glycosyltransferase involved in cell wall biosynthesis